jgi:hypothetical protein
MIATIVTIVSVMLFIFYVGWHHDELVVPLIKKFRRF